MNGTPINGTMGLFIVYWGYHVWYSVSMLRATLGTLQSIQISHCKVLLIDATLISTIHMLQVAKIAY